MLSSISIATEGIGYGSGPIALVGFWTVVIGPDIDLPKSATVALLEDPSAYSVSSTLEMLSAEFTSLDAATAMSRYAVTPRLSIQGGWWGRPWGQPWGGFRCVLSAPTATTPQSRYTVEAVPLSITTVEPECS